MPATNHALSFQQFYECPKKLVNILPEALTLPSFLNEEQKSCLFSLATTPHRLFHQSPELSAFHLLIHAPLVFEDAKNRSYGLLSNFKLLSMASAPLLPKKIPVLVASKLNKVQMQEIVMVELLTSVLCADRPGRNRKSDIKKLDAAFNGAATEFIHTRLCPDSTSKRALALILTLSNSITI